MIDSFYVAATGMGAQQTMIDTIANNVANINTTAFKKSRVDFEDLFYRRLNPATPTENNPDLARVGLGTVVAGTDTVFTPGTLVQTKNQLDVAIQGTGFFEVHDSANNTYFTRVGSLQLSSDGQLQTDSGYDLAATIRVPSNATQLTIASDGTVTALVPNSQQPVQLGQIQLANFVNANGLDSIGNGLYTATDASGQAFYGAPGDNGLGTLNQGYVESSNVDLNTELTNLVLAQQAYQMNSRVVSISDEILNSIANLRR